MTDENIYFVIPRGVLKKFIADTPDTKDTDVDIFKLSEQNVYTEEELEAENYTLSGERVIITKEEYDF